jgi:hypothetical protein
MKQITLEQAAKLATGNKARVKSETYYCQEDWVRANAPYIAAIETGRHDRTLCGEWPKGWKAEMKEVAKQMAKKALLERFLRDECKLLDGAIWLGNWEIIQQLEKQTVADA